MSDHGHRQSKEWGGAVVWLLMTAAVVSALLWGTSFLIKGGDGTAAAAGQAPREEAVAAKTASILPAVPLQAPNTVDLKILPSPYTAAVSNTFEMRIQVEPMTKVAGVDAFIDFNPNFVQIQAITDGGTLGVTFGTNGFNNSVGVISYSASTFSGFPTTVFTLARLAVHVITATPPGGTNLTFSTAEGRVTQIIGGESVADNVTGNLISGTINAYITPTASFEPSAAITGTVPRTVAFTDTSQFNPTSWLWSFGDGGTSTSQNPTRTYTTKGNYTVTLTATNVAGSSVFSRTNLVNLYNPVTATKTASPLTSTVPMTVVFTDISTGDVASRLWSFGDGVTSTLQNPTHTYAAKGVYTVTLAVNGLGGDSSTDTNIEFIHAYNPVVADKTASPLTGTVPLTVVFTDLSTGDVASRLWSFGDGVTSTLQNPTHTYTSRGTYTVTLMVNGLGGDPSTDTNTNYIHAYNPVTAGLTGTPLTGVVPLNVTFTDASTGDVASRLWGFGDGDTSTAQNPTHIYTTVSFFDVFLTVDGLGGDRNTLTRTAYIRGLSPLFANFVGVPVTGGVPLTVAFTDTTTGTEGHGALTYAWNLGDGATSALQNPTHTYQAGGIYTVSLMVTSTYDAKTAVKGSYITAVGNPIANFTASPITGNIPLTVYFTDTSQGDILSQSWDFGDGGGSAAQNPSHVYSNIGSFTVTHVVTGPFGANVIVRTDYITTTGADIFGQIVLDGSLRPASGWAIPLLVTLTASPVQTYIVTTTTKVDSTAVFTVPDVAPGTYTMTIVGAHNLANRKLSLVVTPPTTTVNMGMLREGNINMDSQVNIVDFGLLVKHYLTSSSPAHYLTSVSPGGCLYEFLDWAAAGGTPWIKTARTYNCWADLDWSGQVNIGDFGLMVKSYLRSSPIDLAGPRTGE